MKARELAQWLKALADPLEDLSSVPDTHVRWLSTVTGVTAPKPVLYDILLYITKFCCQLERQPGPLWTTASDCWSIGNTPRKIFAGQCCWSLNWFLSSSWPASTVQVKQRSPLSSAGLFLVTTESSWQLIRNHRISMVIYHMDNPQSLWGTLRLPMNHPKPGLHLLHFSPKLPHNTRLRSPLPLNGFPAWSFKHFHSPPPKYHGQVSQQYHLTIPRLASVSGLPSIAAIKHSDQKEPGS